MFIIFEGSVSVICGEEKCGNFRPKMFRLANYRLCAVKTSRNNYVQSFIDFYAVTSMHSAILSECDS